MNKRCIIRLVLGLAAVFAIYGTPASAAAHYALATSPSKLYLLSSDGGSVSSRVLYDFGSSYTHRDVAVIGKKILVTEKNNDGSQLLVLNLTSSQGTYSANIGNIIALNNGESKVTQVGSIAIDKSGGIYITDSYTFDAKYAYLPNLSSAVQISSLGNDNYPQVDAAAVGNGVVITHENADSYLNGASYATYLAGGGLGGTPAELLKAQNPIAVAGNDMGYAYVVSEGFDGNFDPSYITMYGTSSGVIISPQVLPGIIGGITSFVLNDINYLAIVGTDNGTAKLWKTTVDNSGATSGWTSASGGVDSTRNQQCAASLDGTAVWFTQPGVGHVGLVNTDTWAMSGGLDINDQISSIIGFDAPGSVVPEPSSLAALASFAAAGLAMLRRRHTL
ncbi:MAG: PEP-CTERM sorting domain-containing protein [Armatimonadota bacterium]|nr:PEP-CTERM sorting domain-containing protein [bacterium]